MNSTHYHSHVAAPAAARLRMCAAASVGGCPSITFSVLRTDQGDYGSSG